MAIRSYGFVATVVAALLLVGSAFAQSTTPAPSTKASPAATRAPVVHSAVSLQCSKEADARGLHGKARKKFRAACKRNGGKPPS